MTRDGKIFLAYRLVSRLYFHLPILFVYLFEHGLPVWQCALALGAYGFTVLAFSSFGLKAAERFGERRILVAAEIVKASGILVLVLSPTLAGGLAGEILSGVGFCLSAGPDTLLMRKLFAEKFADLQAKTQSYMFVSVFLAGVAGSILFAHNGRWPLLASIAACLVAAGLVVAITAPVAREAPGGAATVGKAPLGAAIGTWIAFYAVARGVLFGMFVGLMPYYFVRVVHIDVAYFGAVLGAFTLAGFVSARLAGKVARRMSSRSVVAVTGVVMAATILGFATSRIVALSILAMVVLGLVSGGVRPLTLAHLESAGLAPATRRRALSLMERAFGLVNALVITAGGAALAVLSFWQVTLIIAVLVVIVAAFAGFNVPEHGNVASPDPKVAMPGKVG